MAGDGRKHIACRLLLIACAIVFFMSLWATEGQRQRAVHNAISDVVLAVEDRPYTPKDDAGEASASPGSEEAYDIDDSFTVVHVPSRSLFQDQGKLRDERFSYAWYSSRTIYYPDIDRWHADDDGYWRTDEGYLVVASSEYEKGTVIRSSLFGTMQVLDDGCPDGTIDVYVNW
jgi:hypothetical protein